MTETNTWTTLRGFIDSAPFPVEVIPPDSEAARDLAALRLSDESLLGTIILNTGGLIVDHGWLRILGSGSARLGRSVRSWNKEIGFEGQGLLLVADDALGGFFVLNGGVLPGERGQAFYFAPDILTYEPLNCGHTALMQFLLSPGLTDFYKDQRWEGWEAMSEPLDGDHAVFIYPPVWAAGEAVALRHKGSVPLAEALRQMRQATNTATGGKVEIEVDRFLGEGAEG